MPDDHRCLHCGLTRDEHLAGQWCLDALDPLAVWEDRDDPALLINILAEE